MLQVGVKLHFEVGGKCIKAVDGEPGPPAKGYNPEQCSFATDNPPTLTAHGTNKYKSDQQNRSLAVACTRWHRSPVFVQNNC